MNAEALYYEIHLIVGKVDRPLVFGAILQGYQATASEEVAGDVVVTTRAATHAKATAVMNGLHATLGGNGYTVKRKKVEAVVYDWKRPE
jgi:hypothetical protein